MPRIFLHYQQQELTKFIEKSIALSQLYASRSYDFDSEFTTHLSGVERYFQQVGSTSERIEVDRLKLYINTAQKGINPTTLEKVKINRRENIWIASYHCLSQSSQILQEALDIIDQKLNEARISIEQIILTVLQNNMLDDNQLSAYHGIEKSQQLWSELCKNDQISLLDKKLKMTITPQDIYILIDQTISKLNTEYNGKAI